MFVEQRIYTIKPGHVPAYLALFEREGLQVQTRHLGEPVGYYTVEVGTLSQIVSMWRYTDLADRQQRRASLYEDADWQAVTAKLFDMIVSMENKILSPTKFFSLKS